MGLEGALIHDSEALKVKFPTVNLASSARRKLMERAQRMAMAFMGVSKDRSGESATGFLVYLFLDAITAAIFGTHSLASSDAVFRVMRKPVLDSRFRVARAYHMVLLPSWLRRVTFPPSDWVPHPRA